MPSRAARQLIEGIETDFENEVATLTLNFMEALREATPKDTTYASLSWRISIGLANIEQRTDVPQRRARQETSKSVAENWRINTNDLVVSNDAPYINRLDSGHSSQAPSNFVMMTAIKVVNEQ